MKLIDMMMIFVLIEIMKNLGHLASKMSFTTLIERDKIVPFCYIATEPEKKSQLSNIEDCLGNYSKTSTPDHDLYDRHHNHHHNDDHDQYLKKATVSCPKVSLNSTIVAFPAWPIKSSLQANVAKSIKCIFSSRLRVDVRKAHFGSCP